MEFIEKENDIKVGYIYRYKQFFNNSNISYYITNKYVEDRYKFTRIHLNGKHKNKSFTAGFGWYEGDIIIGKVSPLFKLLYRIEYE